MKMSEKWLTQQALRETKLGWQDGPVWKLPKELEEEKKKERTKKMLKFRRTG